MKSNKIFSVRHTIVAVGFLCLLLSAGCKKLVDVPAPLTSISDADVYTTDATAIYVLNGIYMQLSQNGDFLTGQVGVMPLWLGLTGDELTLYRGETNNGIEAFYTNSFATSIPTPSYWGSIYPLIYTCNAVIEGVSKSGTLTPAVSQQLLGEAKFMRAYCYFFLVNLYGDVPVVTGTDYTVNRLLPRAPKAQVYQQMIADLKDAQNLLNANYPDGSLLSTTTDRVRPTKWAATALLARVYLYTSDWANAEAQSTIVINNTAMFSLEPLNEVFLKSSNEAIWELQPVNIGENTRDARVFILPPTGPGFGLAPFGYGEFPAYLSTQQMASFEPGDQRRVNWVDSVNANNTTYYFPYKYKVNGLNAPVTEAQVQLRLGEQYLIRAEARAQLGDVSGSQEDLNAIRARAGLPPTAAGDQSSLITAILHERQVELFAEGGHRWFDLKRTGNVDQVMSLVCPLKGGTWASYKQYFPVPVGDVEHDPNIVQNPGY